MAHPYDHARSSAHKHGGLPEDYMHIHQWFDESKSYLADFRHRAMRHHAEGIFMCERIFGVTFENSEGKLIKTRQIGEQHVMEDLGWIPPVSAWLQTIKAESWMNRVPRLRIPTDPPEDTAIEKVPTAAGTFANVPG